MSQGDTPITVVGRSGGDRIADVARHWHEGSDHALIGPFGGVMCNCLKVAERLTPMLAQAWDAGHHAGVMNYTDNSPDGFRGNPHREA